MTTTASGRKQTSACNGVTTAFPVNFQFISNSDLLVYLHDSAAFDPDNPGTLLTEGVDYTISGVGSGGSAAVVTTSAYASGNYLTRYRETERAQTAEYTPNDGFPAKSHERQLDRLSLVAEEQDDIAVDTRARTQLVPSGEVAPPIPPLAARIGRFRAWDVNGNETVASGTGADGALRVDLASDDGGDLVAFLADGVGAVKRGMRAKSADTVSIRDYGAKCDGITDDTLAIQRAMAASLHIEFDGLIKVSGDDTLFNIRSGHHLHGKNAVIIHETATGITFSADGVDDWHIDGLKGVGGGKANGSAAFIYIRGCNRYRLYGVVPEDITGWAFKIEPGTFDPPRGDQGQFFACGAHRCYYAIEGLPGTGSEYNNFFGFNATECEFGPVVEAGNWQFFGGNVEANLNGFTLLGGTNNGHGQCVGMAFNHNISYNFRANGCTLGFTLSACHFYADGVSLGYIWITSSKGINIIGGKVDSPILLDGSTEYCVLANNDIPGTFAVISGARSSYLMKRGNTTPTGGAWDQNDPADQYVLATRASSAQSLAASTALVLNNEIIDNRAGYDPATGTYVARHTGVHVVNLIAEIDASGGLSFDFLEVLLNGSLFAKMPIMAMSGASAIAFGTIDIPMTKDVDSFQIVTSASFAGVSAVLPANRARLAVAMR